MSDTHKTKDGRTAKKGLYYYMNRAKKRGTSKPGKGSVTDKALRDSAKTAKKEMGGTMNNLNNTKMKLKKKKMTGGQYKLDMNKNGELDGGDFKILGNKNKKKMYGGKMEEEKMMKKGGMKKKMMGGPKKKKMYGGSAMKPKKKSMGGKMKYKTGGFTLEPKTPNLDDL